MLTFLPLEEIAALEAAMQASLAGKSGAQQGAAAQRSGAPVCAFQRCIPLSCTRARLISLRRLPACPSVSSLSPQAPGYEPNTAQRRLAEEVTRFVHGEEGLQQAVKATAALAPGAATTLDAGGPGCGLLARA